MRAFTLAMPSGWLILATGRTNYLAFGCLPEVVIITGDGSSHILLAQGLKAIHRMIPQYTFVDLTNQHALSTQKPGEPFSLKDFRRNVPVSSLDYRILKDVLSATYLFLYICCIHVGPNKRATHPCGYIFLLHYMVLSLERQSLKRILEDLDL
ncbi:uncharacterized protein ARMOST_02493 [Armillaria ostoyae]|uniref:Uncharacterized protein n=1 Tax=Armillaria ostoyae TaxID=47428 RepID=A0A284QRV0_ARMOS|nr:uncharacterized protein ARMOST_02493 [Armillaria ostoyae]